MSQVFEPEPIEEQHGFFKQYVKIAGRKARCALCHGKILIDASYSINNGLICHDTCIEETKNLDNNVRRRTLKLMGIGAAFAGATAIGASRLASASGAQQTQITANGVILPSLTSDPANPEPGQMWYRSDAGVIAHFDAIENRVIYSNRIVDGSAVVSAKGIANGLSVLPNDGQDWGPDTMLGATGPGQYGPPYTESGGIIESLSYKNIAILEDGTYNVTASAYSPTQNSSFGTSYSAINISGSKTIIGRSINGVTINMTEQPNQTSLFKNVNINNTDSLYLVNVTLNGPDNYPSSSSNWAFDVIGMDMLYLENVNINGFQSGIWYGSADGGDPMNSVVVTNLTGTANFSSVSNDWWGGEGGVSYLYVNYVSLNQTYPSGEQLHFIIGDSNGVSIFVDNIVLTTAYFQWIGSSSLEFCHVGKVTVYISDSPNQQPAVILTQVSTSVPASNLMIDELSIFGPVNPTNTIYGLAIGSNAGTYTTLLTNVFIGKLYVNGCTYGLSLGYLDGQVEDVLINQLIAKNTSIQTNSSTLNCIVNSGVFHSVTFDAVSGLLNIKSHNLTPALSVNPPASGTVYQNTNPYDIEIDLPVYATTSGTAGYVAIAKGATSTPATIGNQYVNGATSSTSADIIRLKVPAGWYYSFTASGVTFETASVFAD